MTTPGATEAAPTTTTAETPAPATTERRRGLSQFSVRTRITAVIAILTAAAMSASGLLVYALESARIERAVHRQIDQEIAEFRALRVDPNTGRPFDDVGRILNVFLTRNVPDDDELLVGDVRGEKPIITRNRYGQEFLEDPAYLRAVAAAGSRVRTVEINSARYGEVWVTVVPVANNLGRGALVIVNFLEDEHVELNRTMRTYAVVALFLLGVITALAALQSGRLLAPLRTLRQTASDITVTDLSRRIPERGNDDITALTRTINDMLDRLEAAFAAQRDFLDDAGHELRTPLTVLRGHLELLEQNDPDDVAATKLLLLDEVDRMSRLVGDLILLAKSRRPDFLRREPVSLAHLTDTLLAKARGLGDRDWQREGSGEAVLDIDEQRITQAVLQLTDNAVKHTAPGDAIAIGSSYDGRTARLWVRDTGEGVPLTDRQRIFERFGRAHVREGDEGFGLGLSIVAAIAQAHGGSVHVESGTPTGSRFVISLPSEELRWHAS